MGWEQRGQEIYYYSKKRLPGGRVRSLYVPRRHAPAVDSGCKDRHARVRQRRIELHTWKGLGRRLTQWHAESALVVDWLMLVAGYLHHHKHSWVKIMPKPTISLGPTKAELRAARKRLPTTTAELHATVAEARAGDRGALAVLHTLLDDRQAGPALIATLGDPGLAARQQLAAEADNPLTAEALKRRYEQWRDELAGPGASPAERLLAERAATTWQFLGFLEMAAGPPGHNPARDQVFAKLIDQADGRLREAIKALENVRQKAVPVLRLHADDEESTNADRAGRPKKRQAVG